MKKKPLIIGIVTLVVVALVTALVFLILDYQKQQKELKEKEALKASVGAHVVDDKLYTHFSGVLYVFDEKTNQIELQSAVIMDGQEIEDGTFQGDLSVLDYQHGEDGFLEGTPLVSKKGEFYEVYDKKTCRHNEEQEDGSNKMVTHFTDYEFTYYVYPEDPEFLAVVIYEHYLDDYHIGIFATSEEEAKEGYQWFKANEP